MSPPPHVWVCNPKFNYYVQVERDFASVITIQDQASGN